jgi:Protein of unknown function (DUF3617)
MLSAEMAAGYPGGGDHFGDPMKKCVFFISVILASSALFAADKLQPLNVKLGLWETSMTHATGGMPAMPAIPPEALAKLTPEQRARIEGMMKDRASGTTAVKSCLTKEKIDKQTAFQNERSNCTHTVLSSSGSGFEMKLRCAEKDSTTDGTFKLDVINSENVKGVMHMVVSGSGNNMNIDSTFTGRYLGAACGDVK